MSENSGEQAIANFQNLTLCLHMAYFVKPAVKNTEGFSVYSNMKEKYEISMFENLESENLWHPLVPGGNKTTKKKHLLLEIKTSSQELNPEGYN